MEARSAEPVDRGPVRCGRMVTAAADEPPAAADGQPGVAGAQPSFARRHRRATSTLVGGLAAAGFVYFVIPRILGLGSTLNRLSHGDAWWLAFGVVLESLSIFGDVALLKGVFSGEKNHISWRLSNQITLAGSAATKLLATAGAGGVALTVWALRAAGVPGEEVGTGLVCFDVVMYGVYMAALAIGGFGLRLGLFAGTAPVGLTLVPAIFGMCVILIALSMLVTDEPAQRWLERRAAHSKGRAARRWRRLSTWPRALQAGITAAIAMIRHRDPSLLGALASWGFDIATLWASFEAFGHSPPVAVLVMGYYIGTLANALPLPGGIGGVEGGMIGSFLAFGVNGDLAVLAVLGYRTISYWLPTIPGAIAYVRLHRTLAHGHGEA